MHQYLVRETAQALVAATVETLVQVTAPATRRLQIMRWGISFNGVTATDVPVQVDLLRQTTAGTASAFTPLKIEEADPAALAAAARAFTAEPTPGDVIESHFVTPNGGLFVVQYGLDERPFVAASGRIAIRANAPTSAVTADAFIVWQE